MKRRFCLAALCALTVGCGFAQNVAAVKAQRVARYESVAKAAADAAALMMPRHEEEWFYIENWEKSGDYFNEYDARGNKTVSTFVDELGAVKTENGYNENNRLVSVVQSYRESDGEFVGVTKRLLSYDERVNDVITESLSYEWNGTDWALVVDGYTYKRIITRDDKGNITSAEIQTYSTLGEYEPLERSVITYDENGVARAWKYETMTETEDGDYVMAEIYAMTDMEWESSDGQILVMDSLTKFFAEKDNRLKSGNLYIQGQPVGYVGAEYEGTDNYSFFVVYTSQPMQKEVYTFTVDDENGSYTDGCVAYEDANGDGEFSADELGYTDKIVVTKDRYGRVTENVFSIFDVINSGDRYELTYSPDYGGYPVEQVHYVYDYDVNDYVPYAKVVSSDFYDVRAGISGVNVGNVGVDAVYNLQGVRLNGAKDDLPRGVYIIKSGDKTAKVVK